LLDVNEEEIIQAIEAGKNGLRSAMRNAKSRGCDVDGKFCCATCSAAYWRNLSGEGRKTNNKLIKTGLNYLRLFRDGKGKWKKFPFYYTLYSLYGMDLKIAKAELEYTAPVLERLVRRSTLSDKYGIRRQKLAEKILSQI